MALLGLHSHAGIWFCECYAAGTAACDFPSAATAAASQIADATRLHDHPAACCTTALGTYPQTDTLQSAPPPFLFLSLAQEAERARDRYRAEIADNEAARKDIQGRVQTLVASNQRSQAFLNLLSTFRLQALHLQELKFQMAIRDQVRVGCGCWLYTATAQCCAACVHLAWIGHSLGPGRRDQSVLR